MTRSELRPVSAEEVLKRAPESETGIEDRAQLSKEERHRWCLSRSATGSCKDSSRRSEEMIEEQGK